MKRKTAKEILAESFIEVAQTKKIDKITVKDITENCGYSSATFYRQFKDKYDLIAWSYTQDIRSIVDKLEYTEGSWKQVLTEEAPVYKDPVEWIKYDLEVSKAGLAWLHEITEEAREDYTTFDILKAYYQDEEGDVYWAEAQLEIIECIGRQNWILQQL